MTLTFEIALHCANLSIGGEKPVEKLCISFSMLLCKLRVVVGIVK